MRLLTEEQRHRLAAAKARTRWAGDAHHEAMKVVIAGINKSKRAKRPVPKRGSADYCALLESAGVAAIRVIDAHSGIRRDEPERMARARQDPSLRNCSPLLSVFGAPGVPPGIIPQAAEPEVTGAYEAYLDPMSDGVERTDGTVSRVSAAVDEVLARAIANGVPEGDLLALASFAGVIESSAVEWNGYSWPRTGGDGSGDPGDEMSVFHMRWDSRPLKVIGADAIGCLSTVKGWGALKALLVGPAWVALAGECGVRAAFASGGAILGMM